MNSLIDELGKYLRGFFLFTRVCCLQGNEILVFEIETSLPLLFGLVLREVCNVVMFQRCYRWRHRILWTMNRFIRIISNFIEKTNLYRYTLLPINTNCCFITVHYISIGAEFLQNFFEISFLSRVPA